MLHEILQQKVLRIFDRLNNDRRKGVLAGCLFHVCFLGLYFFLTATVLLLTLNNKIFF